MLLLFISFAAASDKNTALASLEGTLATATSLSVEKSVEFSLEELAKATNDFSMANKIGQGGFGSVYYAELRGEVCYTELSYKLPLCAIVPCHAVN